MKSCLSLAVFFAWINASAAEAPRFVRVSLFDIFKPSKATLSGKAKVAVVAEDGRRRKFQVNRLSISCGGKSPVFMEAGSIKTGGGAIEVIPAEGFLGVGVPGSPEREYEGLIEIRESHGRCLIINRVALDSYARDVACRELRGAGPQALQAQAVLTRTFALSGRRRHKRGNFDFCDLTHCQVYVGRGGCSPKERRLLEKVAGLALLYKGKPADVYYFSTCAGHTASAADVWGPANARPYLRGVPDGRHPNCAASDHMRWRFSVGRSELCAKLGRPECNLETTEVGRGGWIKRIVVRGENDLEMSGDNFHLEMGRMFGWGKFKSARFKLESNKDRFTFRGRGMGHGVGMCQHGAMGMERADKNYRAILRHYFPGTEVSRWP